MPIYYNIPLDGVKLRMCPASDIALPSPRRGPADVHRPSPATGALFRPRLFPCPHRRAQACADIGTYYGQRLGYHVLEAGDGENALALMDRHDRNIELLLTDVVMPGMNGRKLAEDAKRRRPELRVLFMTGYSRNAIVHQGRLDPGVDLIQKPLTGAQLATMVRNVFDA
jgi:CheY-like chemotaxis protein